jgi:3-deoxy-D-manno-octulosonic-acid transferase
VTLAERLFGGAVAAARPLLPALGLVSRELGRAAAERRGVVARLRAWATEDPPDPGTPTLWLHGASAGELTGAAATVAELRRRGPLRLLVTYFSPSAEPALGLLSPDGAEVLPLDTAGETRRALRAVEPDALVFAKGDLWPNLTRSAERMGVPTGLINGAVRRDSSRLRPPARVLLGPAYGRLSRAGAASREDARRLARIGVPGSALAVTGDASFDGALERARRAASDPGSPARLLERAAAGQGPLVVAGSTWRPDEQAVVRAVGRLRDEGRAVRLAVVPHEPDREALDAVERLCRVVLGVAPRLWSELTGWEEPPGDPGDGRAGEPPGDDTAARDDRAPAHRPVVVDAVGVLAELYAAADVAWVGGGLGDTGLHSVVEPAAAGVPVLYGARSGRREADLLEARGGGRAVAGVDGLTGALRELVADREARRSAGRAAREAVEAEAGAAEAGADLVEELLGRRS